MYYDAKTLVRRAQLKSFRHSSKLLQQLHFLAQLAVETSYYLAKKITSSSKKVEIKAYPLEYQLWLCQNTPRKEDLVRYQKEIASFSWQPLVSILMPVYNTPENYLREAIESVVHQIYENWELCIADDCSSEEATIRVLQEFANKDSRIKIIRRTENGHISASSNTALDMASGEYVSLFDHDDLLTPDALFHVVRLLNQFPDAELIYTDEDKIDDNGYFLEPFFKPDWSPDSFLSNNFILHFTTVKTTLMKSIHGFRLGYEGSQDYDLFLRLTEKTNNIHHIPKVLYHWRIHQMSTSGNAPVKMYAFDAGVRALEDALGRRQKKGSVTKIPDMLGYYQVHYKLTEPSSLSVIITLSEPDTKWKVCIDSVLKNAPHLEKEIYVLTTVSNHPQMVEQLAEYQLFKSVPIRLVAIEPSKDYVRQLNMVALSTHGSYLLFINSDIEIKTTDGIMAMMQQAQRASIGMVGAKIGYPNGYVKHAGVVLGINGVYAYPFEGFGSQAHGYAGKLSTVNNYSAVSLSLAMCSKSSFIDAQGFDQRFMANGYDIDLCLKMAESGLNNVYLPDVVAFSSSYRSLKVAEGKDAQLFKEKWSGIIASDPCYNPHLTRTRTDFSFGN